jgi:hypothetical protein
MRRTSLIALLVSMLACSFFGTAAQAQRSRVFVASYGSDSNPCTFGSPCKTFQLAVDVVADGGEVTAIDSAGFGQIAIDKSVTITSPNGVEAGIATPSGGTAITINTTNSANIVNLNGLTLDGVGGATNGIDVANGAILHVRNCVIRNFANDGILIQQDDPNSFQFSISDTQISDNGNDGIETNSAFAFSLFGVLDHVDIENNAGNGLALTNTVSQPMLITVRNSIVAQNSTGVSANNLGAQIVITRSTITENTTGVSTSNGAQVTSYGDNNISNNGISNAATSTIGYQ